MFVVNTGVTHDIYPTVLVVNTGVTRDIYPTALVVNTGVTDAIHPPVAAVMWCLLLLDGHPGSAFVFFSLLYRSAVYHTVSLSLPQREGDDDAI